MEPPPDLQHITPEERQDHRRRWIAVFTAWSLFWMLFVIALLAGLIAVVLDTVS